ncbi:MAG: hypothetical protein WKG01_24355 [Kofleriaceae bacterium]
MSRAWLLVGFVACSSKPQQDPRPPSGSAGETGSGSMMKTPGSAANGAFVQGAALSPGDQLAAWLDAQKLGNEGKLLRLPVVLAKGQVGFQLRGAKLGTGADALTVDLDDTALGIGLGNRARKCSLDGVCAFLVEGYWQGKQGDAYKLRVVKAGEPLAADELGKLGHAEVEGESGN